MPTPKRHPDARLPAGRHGLPRHFVIHSQRERLVSAVAEAAAEHGYAAMTVGHIVARAGVSRRTFYEHFADKQAALISAYDAAMEQLAIALLDALAQADDWRDRLRAAADAFLGSLANEPAFTRLAFVEMPIAGDAARAHHARTIASFELALDRLRPPAPLSPPAIATRVLVRGIQQTILGLVVAGRIAELPSLRPSIMYLLIAPWFGEQEARRELEEHPPPPNHEDPAPPEVSAEKRASASEG